MSPQQITSAINAHLTECEQCQWVSNNVTVELGVTQDGIPVVQVFGHCKIYVDLMRQYP